MILGVTLELRQVESRLCGAAGPGGEATDENRPGGWLAAHLVRLGGRGSRRACLLPRLGGSLALPTTLATRRAHGTVALRSLPPADGLGRPASGGVVAQTAARRRELG